MSLGVLGKTTVYHSQYNASLLYPVPRASGREAVVCEPCAWFGTDVWRCYELSWLDTQGFPQVAMLTVEVPHYSKNLVESKSFKLYLNSFNQSQFANHQAVVSTIKQDISAVCETEVRVLLHALDDRVWPLASPLGDCIDHAVVTNAEADVSWLIPGGATVEQRLYSNLLKSNCPVTGQPDWATLEVHYKGKAFNPNRLVSRVVAMREHQGFHEQCVETIFTEMMAECEPEKLTVQAFYTRRGGIDINPVRSTDHKVVNRALQVRLTRQ